MNNETDWIVVGRFGRPQGLKGYIRVISFTEPQDNLLEYPDWYVKQKQAWQPLKILEVDKHTKFILVRVDGYLEREQAALLTNKDIAILRSALPTLPAGEYYWHDLVGMQVINQQGVLLGKVVELMATGSNDVLVVVGEKRYLIPYLMNDYVVTIDKASRTITVDWDVDF